MMKNIKTRLLYPYLAPYNTREEGQHRKISVYPENRNVWHTKIAMKLLFIDFDFFAIYKADSGGS